MLAATHGVTLDEAFHQLRGRARSSSRKLAEVAQEAEQRDRVADQRDRDQAADDAK